MIQFIAVGTPPDEDGSADLQYVLAAARNIGRLMDDYKLVVDKSNPSPIVAYSAAAQPEAELTTSVVAASAPASG